MSELKTMFVRFAKYCNSLTPRKLEEPLDPIVDGAINDFIESVLDRLEAEGPKKDSFVTGKGDGVDQVNDYTNGYNHAIADQAAVIKRIREELTK